jgi:hypothetical protein
MLFLSIAAVVAMAVMSTAAMAAAPYPVPGPPVAYPCDDVAGVNVGKVATWDDQYFPGIAEECGNASENFLLCLAKYGQFRIETPDVAAWAPYIVDLYLQAGASAFQGKCLPQTRSYWLCYGAAANSLAVFDEVTAIKTLAAGARVPHASKTIKTDTKVGGYFLTCDDQGQKPTGKVVSTGNGGEVVSGPASIGAGLLLTNPLDYTAEIE